MLLLQNTKLNNLIKKTKNKLDASSNLDDISFLLNEISLFSKANDLKFDNKLGWIYISISTFIVFMILIFQGRYDDNTGYFVFFGVTSILTLLFTVVRGKNLISNISNEIYFKSLYIQNKLTDIKCDEYEKYKELNKIFNDFSRGNESRKITRLIQGKSDNQIKYQYYDFHYVEVTTRTVTDSKGNTHTETTRTTHYRYGILINNFKANSITCSSSYIGSDFKEKWKSSSPIFNKHWRVRVDNLIKSARFFTPPVVLLFNDLASLLNAPNFELSINGELCLSFGKDIIAENKPKITFNDIERFKKVVLSDIKLSKINKVIAIIDDIEKRI